MPLVVDQVVSFSGDLVVLGHTQLGHQRDLFTVLAAAGHLLTTTPVQRRYTATSRLVLPLASQFESK